MAFWHGAATRLGDAGAGPAILAVVVPDQGARALVEGRGLAQLLGHPGGGGVARDADMHRAARAKGDHEADVHGPEEQIRDGEEIAGPDVVGVVAQEGRPRLPGATWRAGLAQVAPDRRPGDAGVALQELAPDALHAPQAIRPGHLADQGDGLGCEARAVRGGGGGGFAPPVPAKAFPMPAEEHLRLDDEKRLPPGDGLLRTRSPSAPTATGAPAGRMAAESR